MYEVVDLKEMYDKYEHFLEEVDWTPSFIKMSNDDLESIKQLTDIKVNKIMSKEDIDPRLDLLVPEGYKVSGAVVLSKSTLDRDDVLKTLILNLFQAYVRKRTYVSMDLGYVSLYKVDGALVYTISTFVKEGVIKTFK